MSPLSIERCSFGLTSKSSLAGACARFLELVLIIPDKFEFSVRCARANLSDRSATYAGGVQMFTEVASVKQALTCNIVGYLLFVPLSIFFTNRVWLLVGA